MSSVWSIRRSTVDKKLAGVCGGVARHWNVDPVLVRVGWVLLALSGGVGIVLYAAAWLLVPADGATSSTMDDLTKGSTRGWPREAWVAIVAIACLITFGIFSSTTTIGFGPAVVLALIWYFGYYKTRVKKSTPPPSAPPQAALTGQPVSSTPPPPAEPFRYPGPPTPFTEAAEAWRQRVDDMRRSSGAATSAPFSSVRTPASQPGWSRPPTDPAPVAAPAWQTYPATAGPSTVQDPVPPELAEAAAHADFLATPDPVGLYSEVPPAKAAAAPSRRTQAHSLSARRLRLVSVLVLGLVLLGLAVADALGAPITPVIYAAAALLVVGLTLVAATWLGRARGILPVGLLLLVAVLGLSLAVPASRFVHQVGYSSVAQLPAAPVTMERGVLKVDLSRLEVTSDATFAADLGTGAVEILAPANTNIVLDYSVRNGVVLDNDQTVASGENLNGTSPLGRSVDSEPTLTLDIEADQGVVAVKR